MARVVTISETEVKADHFRVITISVSNAYLRMLK